MTSILNGLEDITQQKRERAHTIAVREIPRLRALGLGVLSIAVFLHNRFLLPDLSIRYWELLTAIFIVYATVSWVVTRAFYRRIDLTLPFLIGDVGVLTLAIYFSGAERSWLFPVLLTKVADQTQTTYRRSVMFTVLTTCS